jgi:hypothetical protein
VRKLKPKGAPEVVYGRDGVPLILPIDADIEDLRREARADGRYRLDSVDEQNRPIPVAVAGYVCVQPPETKAELAPLASRTPSDSVIIEAMRMNTELARTVIDRFPQMLESAAALLRAADGAGLPAREPRAVANANDDDGDQGDGAPETEEVAPKATGLQGLIETLVPIVAPAIVSAIAGGKVKIPGGVGALLDCRRASPKARAAASAPATHVTSTPGAAPAPGPRDPAPATGGTSHAENEAAPGLVSASGSATEDAAALPTLDPAALAHFAAIQGALTFREGMLARALAAELSPAELRTWLTELVALSVPEAVAKIRGVIGPDPDNNTSGGAS